MQKAFDILLLGYYGFGNLGDELLAEAAVSLLCEAGLKKERIAILSASPDESYKKFGIKAFNRWSIKDIVKACSASSVLMLGGGGLFQESTSLRSCFYYYSVMRIARLCGCTLAAEGQSVGPLHSKTAQFLARDALRLCGHLSVRDEAALEWTKKWGLPADVTPDIVLSLPAERTRHNGNTLLLNIRPGHRELALKTCICASEYAKKNGLIIKGAALSEEDAAELNELKRFQNTPIEDIIIIKDLADFTEAAGSAAGAVGMRLHFLILCTLSGVPCAGCAYDPKVSGFCKEYGIPAVSGGFDVSLSPVLDSGKLEDDRKLIRRSIENALERVL